jgi:exonuclease SbcC
MIESIAIRNFQIHKKTEVEFDPGITIISGTSDNGKSSIIRAFRWVFQNRPQGYSFRRWNTPDKAITAVDVSVDGEVISRKRGKVRNEYVFQDTTYKALRSDVPDIIKEHVEMLPFNIQPQSGKVFLFEDSDSEVAKLINDVSGISVIDDILKESNRRLRELNSEEKILNDMIKNKKAQASSLKVFVGLNKRVRAINESYSEVEEKESLLSGIE